MATHAPSPSHDPATPSTVQAVPAATAVWVHVPPEQVSVVQGLPSSQLTPAHGSAGTQVPFWQVPPLQGTFESGVWRQPLAGSQVSAVQGLPSSQETAVPPPQVPFWQVVPVTQALPS